MPESWKELFAPEFFMPHGHCYLWKPGLVWLQVLSNGAIALAYIAIFATLVYLLRRISGIPFQRMYLAFAVFIVSCGFTHVFDIIVIWDPAYWLDGSMRAVTAVASLGTAVLLPPLVPKAVALAEAARLSQERGVQLEAANREMAVLLEKTKELEQLKTQFFANVSHELRTPLALILGPAESLESGANLTDAQRRDVRLIGSNARALLKHVNDLLDMSKLEAGKVTPEYIEADVGRIVTRLAANFDGVARERSIAYRVDAGEVRAQVDADKLERVALNLLSNAFKFTPAGGQIRCSLRGERDGRFRLEVADSGPGVRPQDRALIFERFRQGDGGATRKVGGTGLGLAIAKEFVELHGGSIAVGDAAEGGARFTVEVPMRAPSGVVVGAPAADGSPHHVEALRPVIAELLPRPEPLPAPQHGDQPLVLVVEDNVEMNRFVQETLAKRYRVVSAFDGRQGLEKARELKPDLILTDMMMPELSGDQLVQALQADPALAHIPIVLLTAKADDELRIKLLRDGARDYLMKPFSIEELEARIENLVSAKRARDVLLREVDVQSSDLEQLAHQVASRKREIELAVASLRVAREQAEHASQAKSNFLGLVSHELRTPITALQLQVERMQRSRDAKSERQSEILTRMSGSAGRLGNLVDSLLSYARISSGRLTTEVQDFDLLRVIGDAVDELRPQAEAKGLSIVLVAAPDLPPFNSDPQLVRLILANLVGNAVKFTEHGGVEVELQRTEGAHRVLVKDTGPGIPGHEHARIFEPFEHIEPTRKKHTPGIGLGLAIVREMVGALEGRVELESEVGRGSTFIVTLPNGPPSLARGRDAPLATTRWQETCS